MIVHELKGGFTDWDNVTQRTVAEQIMRVMKSHIGRDNCVEKEKLFKKTFGLYPEDVSPLNRQLLNDYFHRANTLLRSRSDCFIMHDYYGGESVYYVISDDNDLDVYRENTNKFIRGLQRMKQRAKRSVDNEWHKRDEWSIIK